VRCLLADAQFFVARCHGFASWPKFAKHWKRWRAPIRRSRHSKRRSTPSSAATLQRSRGC
jgi:hypothetical protein